MKMSKLHLKAREVLVNSEKKKNLMGFVYRVLWILKALWIVLSETINILRDLQPKKKKKKIGMPPRILP